jgi:hypothetical protein
MKAFEERFEERLHVAHSSQPILPCDAAPPAAGLSAYDIIGLSPIQTDIVSRAAHELLRGGPGMPDWWLSEASDYASQPQTLDQWAAAEKPPLPGPRDWS